MQWFKTPKGEAGADRLDAMEESIQAAIEQMFWQLAKRDSLSFGVGRMAAKSSDNPDNDDRLDAQKRECDGLIVFHAGKALETSLQVIYAKINNRILGREYPGVCEKQMNKDRRTHNLVEHYNKILDSFSTRPDLRKTLEDEFESAYQIVYHRGVIDLTIDGDLIDQFFLVEDAPFREAKMGGLRHGAEITMDNSAVSQLLMPTKGETDFSRMPCRNFREFLTKADVAYYGNRNMRWGHYSARDHQRGRPYVVVGSRFFARLAQSLVELGNQQWMWNEQLARRWHERRRSIIGKLVNSHIRQSFTKKLELPEMRSVDDMMEQFRSMKFLHKKDYDRLHGRWTFDRVGQDSDDDCK